MLNNLPSELLEAIVSSIEGVGIGRLWLCGDSRLNARLGAGGAVKSFRVHFDSLCPVQWPSLVRHFVHLEHFKTSFGRDATVMAWVPRYSELNRSIRRLNLSFKSDFFGLQDAFTGGHTFTCLEELTGLAPKSTSNAAAQEMISNFLALLPPCLTNLQFQHANYSSDFAYSNYEKMYWPVPTSYWPRNLRKLTLSLICSENEPEPVLPLSLEELDLSIQDPNRYDGRDHVREIYAAIALIPNLRKLRILLYSLNMTSLTIEDIRRLPRSLNHLEMDFLEFSFDADLMIALPPMLTELDTRVNRTIVDISLLELLPRSLTKFGNLPFPTVETLKVFPPNIASLDQLYMLPEIVAALPPGLRSAKFRPADGGHETTNLVWPKLPDTLTEVRNLSPGYLDQHPLPTNLQVFKLTTGDLTDGHVKRFSSTKIASLSLKYCSYNTEHLFKHIPRYLTRLRLIGNPIMRMDDTDCKNLPKHLVDLELNPVDFNCSHPLSYFPRGLKHLEMRTTSLEIGCIGEGRGFFPELVSLCFRIQEYPAGLAHYLLTNLPRQLKQFTITAPALIDFDLTDESLLSLPPGLLQLIAKPAPMVKGTWKTKKPAFLDNIRL